MTARSRRLLAGLACALVAAFAILELPPPAVRRGEAPAREFSARRALADVEAIAWRPHPLGSAADLAVHDYLRARLAAIGLHPEEVDGMGYYRQRDGEASGWTRNLVGRLAGAASSGAIVLTAHYDSTAHGPGAADDAAGVAALLEAARALAAGPRLRNDLAVVLTDGEERGLLGADAYARARGTSDIGLLLNFDARGDRGPALLFESSPGDRPLIAAAARLPGLEGSSLFAPLYRRLLPNDTDFSVFLPAHVPGLNFALIEGYDAYHTPLDTPARLDLASLQQEGDLALGLARSFAAAALPPLRTTRQDDIFFDLWGGHLVAYPMRWTWPGEAALLLCFGLAWHRARRWSWDLAGLALVTAANLALAAALPAGAYLLFWPLLVAVAGRCLAPRHPFAALPGALTAALLFAPPIYFLFVVLRLSPLALAGALLLASVAALLSLPLWAV